MGLRKVAVVASQFFLPKNEKGFLKAVRVFVGEKNSGKSGKMTVKSRLILAVVQLIMTSTISFHT